MVRRIGTLVAGAALLAPATAAAAPPDLTVRTVKSAGSVRVGEALSARVTVHNRGKGNAKKATLRLFLSRTAKRPKVAVALTGKPRVKALKKRRRATVITALTIPAATTPGRYYLTACVKPARRPKDRSKKNDCRAGRVLTVLPKPAAIVPLPPPLAPVAPQPPAPTGDPTPPPVPPGPPDEPPPPPPEPEPEPEPVDGAPTETPPFDESVDFLYTGDDAIQQDVEDGAIVKRRVAVLRGVVHDRAGDPVAGARVEIVGHPELGYSTTYENGGFDIAVNGGDAVVVSVTRAGFLPSQRTIDTPWRDYAAVEPIVLVPYAAEATPVDPAAGGIQVVRGTVSSDASGERQSTLLFPPDADPVMRFAGGRRRAVGEEPFHVRTTEYTVGESGYNAMPGTLPPSVGYTYALELTVDEAVEAGAAGVEFDKPVYHYTENFIGAPVGSAVPNGYYDREQGRWLAQPNGIVLQVVGESGAPLLADLDVTGDGAADTGEALTKLGITDAEREQLAALYDVGAQLWRVPLTHFSPFDHNFPFGPPMGIKPYEIKPFVWKPPPGDCPIFSSVIMCESQAVAETVPLEGTPYSLWHASDRQPGYTVPDQLEVGITGDEIDPLLKGAAVRVEVAGQVFEKRWKASQFPDAAEVLTPNLTWKVPWDRRDAYGRPVLGSVYARITLVQIYDLIRYPSEPEWTLAWALSGDDDRGFPGIGPCPEPVSLDITVVRGRASATGEEESAFCGAPVTRTGDQIVGGWNARGVGLGGWNVDVHHGYDPSRRMVYKGDGTKQAATAVDQVVQPFAGGGNTKPGTTPAPASQVTLLGMNNLDLGPDGSVYASLTLNDSQVVRVDPETNLVQRIAGTGQKGVPSGDGGPATEAVLGGTIWDVQAGPDGSVYLAVTGEGNAGFIRRVAPDGVITTVAGRAWAEPGGRPESGPATEIKLGAITHLEVAPDGTLYAREDGANVTGVGFTEERIIRIGPDGGLSRFAGAGTGSHTEDIAGEPAIEHTFQAISGLALMDDGSLLVSDYFANRVSRIGTDGIIRRFAGTGDGGHDGDGAQAASAHVGTPTGLATLRDGTVLIRQTIGSSDIIRAVGPDGVIRRFAGEVWGTCHSFKPGQAAGQTCLGFQSHDVVERGDGTLLYSDGDVAIRTIEPAMPSTFGVSEIAIPSADGEELWEFSTSGRHLRTRDALTRDVLLSFGYDDRGRLASITDRDGNVIAITRDWEAGTVDLRAPGGRKTRLTLDDAGWAVSAKAPSGGLATFVPRADGLLSSFAAPGHKSTTFQYDDLGRLTKETTGAGLVHTLAREEDPLSLAVTITSGGVPRTVATEVALDGTRTRTETRAGAVTTTVQRPDGTLVRTGADGTVAEVKSAADPRFNGALQYAAETKITTPAGRVWTQTRARTSTAAGAFTETVTRKDTGGANRTAQTVYDPATRRLRSRSLAGREAIAQLDAKGRVVEEDFDTSRTTDAKRVTAYDARGRRTSETTGKWGTTWEWDDADRVLGQEDAAGRRLELVYDAAGRLSGKRSPDGHLYSWGLDEAGQTTSLTTPLGHGMTLGRGDDDLVESLLVAGDEEATTWAFGTDRLLDATTTPGGATTTVEHDPAGRIESVTAPDGAAGLSFDAAGRVGGFSRGAQESTVTFDGGLVTAIAQTGPSTATTTYDFDHTLRPTQQTVTAGEQSIATALPRDADGYQTGEGEFTFTRGALARITGIAGGGLNLTLTRTPEATLGGRSARVGDAGAFYAETIDTDAAGLVRARRETVGGVETVTTYGYDDDGRLTTVDRGGERVETYTYDADGNRTSRRIGGGPAEAATFGADGGILTQGPVTVARNADGSVTGRAGATFVPGVGGRLQSATVDGATATYAYDVYGRRTARTQGGATERYVYGDPDDIYRVTAWIEPDGTLVRPYYDEDGGLYAFRRGAELFFAGSDHLGSPRVITNSSGTVVASYDYDAFGGRTADEDGVHVPIGFGGGLQDPLTGLVRLGVRDYDPLTGQFISRDPSFFSEDLHLYAYVGGSPQSAIDRTGLGCGGGSISNGAMVGASGCVDEDSIGGCLEIGVAKPGASYSYDHLGKPSDSLSVGGEVSLSAGAYGGISLSASQDILNPCAPAKFGLSVSLGPYKGGVDSSGKFSFGGRNIKTSDFAKDPKWGVTAKASIKGCASMNI